MSKLDQMMYSVVVPIYNESGNILPLLEEIQAALEPRARPFEVIAVDDGSTDGSDKILRAATGRYPFLRVLTFYRNRGQSAAFDAGIQHSSGQVIITLDADLQNDPADIPALLDRLGEGFDVVTGWRRNRKDGLFLRTIPSRIANWVIRRVTKTRVHDLGCSLRVYRADLLRELRLYGEMHRYICPLLENLGARIGEQVVNHRARRAGVSKYGMGRVFKVLLDMLYVWFNRSYQTKPMYVFGGIGGALLGVSVLLSGVSAWERLALGVFVHRNPIFLMALVCLVVAIQFFATGLLAELLMRTYFESRGADSYLIRERFGFGPTAPLRIREPAQLLEHGGDA